MDEEFAKTGFDVGSPIARGGQGSVHFFRTCEEVKRSSEKKLVIKLLDARNEGLNVRRNRGEPMACSLEAISGVVKPSCMLYFKEGVDCEEDVIQRFYDEGALQVAVVMPFIDGVTMHDVFHPKDKIAFDPNCLKHVFLGIASSIEGLAKKGVAHRDIKPANIMISEDGLPFLVDLGLARQYSSQEISPETPRGSLLYMSPERLNSTCFSPQNDFFVRSDVFSLGVMMYEWTMGILPWEPYENALMLYNHRTFKGGEEGLKTVVRQQLDPPLAHATLSMLEVNPNLRWGIDNVISFLVAYDKPICQKKTPLLTV